MASVRGNPTWDRGRAAGAVAFLREVLSWGPVAAVAIKAGAVAAGISWRTVERAKAQLKVWAYKDGEGWYWKLRNT